MGVGWIAWTAAWVLVLGIWRAVRGSARVLVRASNCGGVAGNWWLRILGGG